MALVKGGGEVALKFTPLEFETVLMANENGITGSVKIYSVGV